jgi:hypothetical protein
MHVHLADFQLHGVKIGAQLLVVRLVDSFFLFLCLESVFVVRCLTLGLAKITDS